MKRNKQRLFEVMQKVNPDFKPKLNEGVNEISTGMANRAGTDSTENILKTYAAQPFSMDAHQKALRQTSTFRDYVNPELKKYLESKGFQVEKTINGTIKLTIDDVPLYIWDDSFKFGDGFTSDMLPQEIRAELPEIVKIVQADLNGEKGEFNPAQQVNEGSKIINPKYTHFAVTKDTNEIVNGWDYNGVEPVELRQFKKDYFFNDLSDMGIDPHNINVVTVKYLQRSGTNPFDPANWKQDANPTTLQEGRQGFKRLTVFRIYDKNGSYLGDLDPIDEQERQSEFYEGTKTEVFKTPEFQKLAQAKNITPEQVGRVVKDSEYTMDGNPLEMEHYAPSDSMELYDPKHRVFYNRSGQQLRNPREYDRSDPEWTPFGDEGDY